jgi:hypothetical protein
LRGSIGQSSDAPNQQAEGWEDRPSEDEDQPPEVRDQGEQGDQTDSDRDEHGEARADLGLRTHLLYVQAEEVLRIPPVGAVAPAAGLKVAIWSLLHRSTSNLNISATPQMYHARRHEARTRRQGAKVLTSSQLQRRLADGFA